MTELIPSSQTDRRAFLKTSLITGVGVSIMGLSVATRNHKLPGPHL